MIAAICLGDQQNPGGAIAGAAVNGPTDTDVFVAWIKHALLPVLTAGMVVIMDNLRPHQSPLVRQLITSAGCSLLYLPPYSPDYNPIEPIWNKVKSHIRAAEPRTQAALHTALLEGLASISSTDARGFFTGAGYLPRKT